MGREARSDTEIINAAVVTVSSTNVSRSRATRTYDWGEREELRTDNRTLGAKCLLLWKEQVPGDR